MTPLLTQPRRRRPVPVLAVSADAAVRHLRAALVVGRLPHALPIRVALLAQHIDQGEPWEGDAEANAVIGRIGARAQTGTQLWQTWDWLRVIPGLEQQLGLTLEFR